MGIQQSVNIQTPAFVQKEWVYVTNEHEYPEEYGFYKVLQNIKTNQKIDEYQIHWANEEQFNYYLKFFNWRHSQSNVVNTKFIVNHSQNQICSNTYSAKVYIEHMRIRLSEINDIPYPQNLYVLMEALEGYKQIFKLSNYFEIEENQICVDELGNVKIWVNEDLSVNYLNNREGDQKANGQEVMIQKLVQTIAENTDQQTQPSPSFLQYFEQKRLNKSIDFQQAKVLVLNYARINRTEIPTKFESVLMMDQDFNMNDQEQQRSNVTSLYNGGQARRSIIVQQDYHQKNDKNFGQNRQASSDLISNPNTASNFSQSHYNNRMPSYNAYNNNMHIFPNNNTHANTFYSHPAPHHANPQFPHFQQEQRPVQYVNAYPNQVQYQNNQGFIPNNNFIHINQVPLVNRISYQQNMGGSPQVHIPHYIKIQHPQRQLNQNFPHPQMASQLPLQPQSSNIINAQPLIPKESNAYRQGVQQKQRKSSLINELNQQKIKKLEQKGQQNTFMNPPNISKDENYDDEYEEQDYYQEDYNDDYQQQEEYREAEPDLTQQKYMNQIIRSQQVSNIQIKQNLIAKSLPIQGGQYQIQGQRLQSFGQDKNIYSHINQDQWNNVSSNNSNAFGLLSKKQSSLASNSQLKMKESSFSQQKHVAITKRSIKPIKYYSSLDQEFQIDPDIAADLAKYL